MSLWVVVGGQFGSEGKGKIAASIAIHEDVDVAIRCGGPNSGHSFVDTDGSNKVVRQVPTAFINPRSRLLIPAGAIVDLDVLKYELETLSLDERRVGVDCNAMIIEQKDKDTEARLALGERLSSTLCGVGAAAARRALRDADVRLAKTAANKNAWLRKLLTDASSETNRVLDNGGNAVIEGTQGFGLSLFHANCYPKTTSKDTTAAAFLSEVGVSPLRVTNVIVVMRTFPIRVAGAQAGPLKDEISWQRLQQESGYPFTIAERTTVTKRLRRVGRFDWDLAQRAVAVNRPTSIAINCVDHLNHADRAIRVVDDLSPMSKLFLKELEARLAVPVSHVGTSPALIDVIVASEAAVACRPTTRYGELSA